MIIHFVLINTIYPENIGSAARAINTMGFDSLRLVNPCDHLADQAKWLAHGSTDILIKANVFNSFEESIADVDFVIGTTSKSRTVKFDYYDSAKIPDIIFNKKESIDSVAIVFGGEESGLNNEILLKCDIASTIPMKTKYPSINLAQSVMIYSYLLSANGINNTVSIEKHTRDDSYKSLLIKAEKVLKNIEVLPDTNIYNRIFERLAVMGEDDINLIHSVCNALIKKK